MSVGHRLAAAAASLSGRGTAAEVAAIRQQCVAITAERDQLLTINRASQETIISLRAELCAAEEAVTEFEKKVTAHSVELVASAGIPINQLPMAEGAGSSTGVPATREQLEARMKSLPIPEAVRLLREFNAANCKN